MKPERWERVQALFRAAEPLASAERERYLEAACGGDGELRRDVEGLLASAVEADGYFEALARRVGVPGDPAAPTRPEGSADGADVPLAGRRLGAYRLLRVAGRGGMGAVYLAERADGAFEKRVAVKLLPLGVDSEEARARFRMERQVLAGLDHPHIARLLDGGVAEDGTPYFVMEWVEGRPIDRYSDERRTGLRARLELYLQVCRAVQYAHQRLVVHRDLKPSNIIVGPDGRVKLLDFGIAKLLSDGAGLSQPLTRTGYRLLTPRFAAPEQLLGGPITTATDVYALGVLLHELLTGVGPYRVGSESQGPGELERAILEEEPLRPSVAVARAEASRNVASSRDTTPEALRRRLRGDLDNIVLKALEKDPAHRYPAVQPLIDDVDRHLTGLPILARPPGRQYRLRKFVGRHRAGVAAALVVGLSLTGGLGASLWQARRAAVERDVAERERAKAEGVSQFLVGLFEAADPLGTGAERTDTLRARALIDRGVERIRGELEDQPGLRAEILATLGRVYASLGLYGRGEGVLREALALQADEPRAGLVAISTLARIAVEQSEFSEADSLYAIVLGRIQGREREPETDSLYIATLSERGVAKAYQGDYEGARELHERALELARARMPATEDGGSLLPRILVNLGSLHHEMGDYQAAEPLFRDALARARAGGRADHPTVATTLNNVASTVHYQGRHAEAEPLYVEAIDIARRVLGPSHSELGNYLQNLATLYDDQGRYAEAEALYRESVAIYEAAFGTNARTAMLLRNFALNRYAAGDLSEAERLLREAHAALEAELGPDHLYAALTSGALGRILTARGELEEALPRIGRALEHLQAQLPPRHYLLQATRRDLGAALAARGEYDRAEPLLLESYSALLADRGSEHYLTVEAREHLRSLYVSWGKPDQALRYAAGGP